MFSKELFKKYIYPVATLSGSIIGVGFFSLPYVAMKAGIWLTLFYFTVLTVVMLGIHLIFAEISLNTPDFKRFPGFAGHYLGKKGEAVALIASVVGTFGVLLAYLIIGGEFLSGILSPYIGGNSASYTFFYFLAAGIIVFFGIKIISKVELFVLLLLFVSIIFIFIKGFFQIKSGNIFALPAATLGDWKNFFLPYGPIIFAMWGTGLIPEVEEMLIGSKELVKKVIVISTLIPAIIYLLFTLLILGITGGQTTETALSGLGNFLGSGVVSIALLAGVATTFAAFVSQALTLKKTLMYDLGVKPWQAFVMTCFTPLILFLLGLKSFIPLVSFIGGILLGIDGILILLMYKKIGGKKSLIYSLSLIFMLGIIYELVYSIK